MKKFGASIVIVCSWLSLFTSCNTATPENYFDVAVLNVNMLTGFANDGLARELESPSLKLIEGTKDQSAPMKRKEVIDTKIKFLQENFENLKQLKVTDDTKEMLQTSIALNEYVIPVYKNEYTQLAALYDEGAPKEKIEAATQHIHDTYFPGFEKQFNNLIAAGKVYAARHNIIVHWPN